MGRKIEFEGEVRSANVLDSNGNAIYGRLVITKPDNLGLVLGQKYHVTLEPVELELKQCPFCGGEGKVREFPGISPAVSVICEDCGAEGEGFGPIGKKAKQYAIEAWNERFNG